MNVVKIFGLLVNGEPRVWWHWQNTNRDRNDRIKGWAKSGRIWLHWYSSETNTNCIGFEWSLFRKRFGLSIDFSSNDDSVFLFSLSVPFVGSFYFTIDRCAWMKNLPGVRWKNGDYYSGERSVGFHITEWVLFWRLWRNPMISNRHDWRDSAFHIDDFFLGSRSYSESDRYKVETYVPMPEGDYPCTVEIYTAVWKRSRWPWPVTVDRATIKIPGGIPIPGDADSDFYDGDDLTYEITINASTADQARIEVWQDAMTERRKYGGENWIPENGWPSHCVKNE